MKAAFDTSVIVPALVRTRSHHQRAHIWVQAVVDGKLDGVMSWHAIAEAWSVLTRLPLTPKLTGEEARTILERLQQYFSLIELGAEVYDAALRRCADAGVISGAVFDAIHLVAAETAKADVILTLNSKHFSPLRIETSPQIIVPPDPPELVLVTTAPTVPSRSDAAARSSDEPA